MASVSWASWASLSCQGETTASVSRLGSKLVFNPSASNNDGTQTTLQAQACLSRRSPGALCGTAQARSWSVAGPRLSSGVRAQDQIWGGDGLILGTSGTGTPGPSPGTRLSCGCCPAPCRPGHWLGRSCLCPKGRSPARTEKGDWLCSPHTGQRWTWLSAWPA